MIRLHISHIFFDEYGNIQSIAFDDLTESPTGAELAEFIQDFARYTYPPENKADETPKAENDGNIQAT